MKAQEHFDKYLKENQNEDSTYRVVLALFDIFKEIKQIQLDRNATTNSALIAILNEQNVKANSFIRKINKIDAVGIKPNAFKTFINDQIPEIGRLAGW